MARRTNQTLLQTKPEMAMAVKMAKGDGTAAMAVEDAEKEEFAGKEMYIQMFEVGKCYFFETAIWVYLGRVVHTGHDFIVIDGASRVAIDGSHHTMQETGVADGMEIEMTGLHPDHQVRLPLDWLGSTWEFVHPLPTTSV